MCSTNLSIDIPFSTPVITSQATAIILRTVIEFLAYYKKQIPFPYDTFKLMTAKIKKQIANAEGPSDDWLHMQIERQQTLAIETFDNFKIMLEVGQFDVLLVLLLLRFTRIIIMLSSDIRYGPFLILQRTFVVGTFVNRSIPLCMNLFTSRNNDKSDASTSFVYENHVSF